MVWAVFPETLEVRTRRSIRSVSGSTRLVLTNRSKKGTIMAGSTSETPVLDLLASMTANSIEASSLDPETLMLVRIAALASVDAPSVSYLMNLEVAGELDIDRIRCEASSPPSPPSSAPRVSRPQRARSSRRSKSRSRSRRSRQRASSHGHAVARFSIEALPAPGSSSPGLRWDLTRGPVRANSQEEHP